jgi:hypothetical protein
MGIRRLLRVAHATQWLLFVACVGCSAGQKAQPVAELPPGGIKPTRIDYVDTDAFDALLENALTNQDPAIVIGTGQERPEWGGRLNAWIAAWNAGGRATPPATPPRARGQIGLPKVVVDGDSIREFRLLIDDFMNRVEGLARDTSVWWTDAKVRSRRVALLKPYSLRFHQDAGKNIQLILFHGAYSRSYEEFMRSIAEPDADEPVAWVRGFSCSRCRPERQAQADAPD